MGAQGLNIFEYANICDQTLINPIFGSQLVN